MVNTFASASVNSASANSSSVNTLGEEEAVVAPQNTEPAPVEAAGAALKGDAGAALEEAGLPPKIDLFFGGDLMAVKMDAKEDTADT